MTFITEAQAERWYMRRLRADGHLVQKLQLRYTCGFPDLLVIVKGGQVSFLELKPFRVDLIRSLKQVTRLQQHQLDVLQRAGVAAAVVVLESPTAAHAARPWILGWRTESFNPTVDPLPSGSRPESPGTPAAAAPAPAA